MDLSANCSSRLSARVSDLHPVFLSEWVDTDPADEMTRVSVHPPGHSGVCCAAYCYGGLINQPFVDLWSTFSWSILRLGARLHSVCVCVCRRRVPSCRCGDKNPVAKCVTRLSWYFEYYQLSFMRGTVGGNPGRDPSKTGRADQDTHRRSLEKKRPQSGKGINSPSSLHLAPTLAASLLSFVEKLQENAPELWSMDLSRGHTGSPGQKRWNSHRAPTAFFGMRPVCWQQPPKKPFWFMKFHPNSKR